MYFPGEDTTKGSQEGLGKCFASPKKKQTPRAKRAKGRDVNNNDITTIEDSVPRSKALKRHNITSATVLNIISSQGGGQERSK